MGTPHIPFEVIWSDVQTRVVTPHYIERTNPYAGQMGGSNVILDPSLAVIRVQFGFGIQVGAKCAKEYVGSA